MKKDDKFHRLQHEMAMLTETHKRLRAKNKKLLEACDAALNFISNVDNGSTNYELNVLLTKALAEAEGKRK